MSFKDFYGNETQHETPTTALLKDRRKSKVESDGKFRLSLKAYPEVKAALIIHALEGALENLREYDKKYPDERYIFGGVEVTQK